jgi:flagellar FliJ protein
MRAIKSLLLAIDLATRKRDQASQMVMGVQNAQIFAQQQMGQLQIYATETEARWQAAAQVMTTPELMQHHYQFMDRLHHAIGLQESALENAARKTEAAKRLALEAEFRLVNLKQVLKKKQAEMGILESRREQKQMDEFASMQTRQTTGVFSNGSSHEY